MNQTDLTAPEMPQQVLMNLIDETIERIASAMPPGRRYKPYGGYAVRIVHKPQGGPR